MRYTPDQLAILRLLASGRRYRGTLSREIQADLDAWIRRGAVIDQQRWLSLTPLGQQILDGDLPEVSSESPRAVGRPRKQV